MGTGGTSVRSLGKRRCHDSTLVFVDDDGGAPLFLEIMDATGEVRAVRCNDA